MWWYGYGWWWWWLVFVFLFFLIPLGYGWGYRGWGPWYRRTRITDGGRPAPGSSYYGDVNRTGQWGAFSAVLWVVLIIALIWFLLALAWAA